MDGCFQSEEYQLLMQNQSASHLLANPILKKDIWHIVNDLNLKSPEHRKFKTVNFEDFHQEWFKLLVKLYTVLRVNQGVSAATIQRDIFNLQKLSEVLERESIDQCDQITENIFEKIDIYLQSKRLKEVTVHRYYATFLKFFDVCRLEEWLNINTYWFKGKRHRIYPGLDEINYIPEEVWNQLEQNLHCLPEPLQRMILAIRTTGIRVGELLNLPLDCLRQRGKQWRLRMRTEKYDEDDELPIPPELAAVIKEQQEYIKHQFGDSYNKLFCHSQAGGWKTLRKNDDGTVVDEMVFEPCSQVMPNNMFNHWLNRLVRKCNIQSKDGKAWHFSSHQFRRTVATVLTNAGIRDLIIKKYLRHRSLEMQNYYKHLLKQVLADEYQELIQEKKYVDITGKVVATHKPQNLITELLRRKMYQITTQYGECHRPTLKESCHTVNACWRCTQWRVSSEDLPYLKQDLLRVEEEIEIAEKSGMTRQQKGLQDDRESLANCIQGLEES